ncbi:MAG: glycosyltransferase [Armatimonadetes bacterium]|nr:glycosyltransferase [Armatimonadota bacterium]
MSKYPPISLDYLKALTDCTGIYQHAVHSVPNLKLGYTTDDNARALIVAAKHYDLTGDPSDLALATRYLSFIHYAHTSEGYFRNDMSFQRNFLDEHGTEDCYGRAIWGCGCAASSKLPENVSIVAKKLLIDSLGRVGDLESPRARAYAILGMYNFLQQNEDTNGIADKITALADSLVAGYATYHDKEWHWFEPYLTYGNAILVHAMLVAAEITGKKSHKNVAMKTLGFLTDTLIVNGRLEIIGNNGWYLKGRERAWYDQQSIDAGYTACLFAEAYKQLRQKEYLELAYTSYDWFFGKNRSGVWVYDPVNKGCYDAVTPWGLNLNQGAEACISFLLAQLAIHNLEQEIESASKNPSHGGFEQNENKRNYDDASDNSKRKRSARRSSSLAEQCKD